MSWFTSAVTAPRTDGVCPALRDRCRVDNVRRALGVDAETGEPLGEAYAIPADTAAASLPLGREDQVWGRLVFLRPSAPWGGNPEHPTRRRVLRILARAEVHSPGGGHDPAYELEAAHAAAHARLCPDPGGWRPDLAGASVALPLWREDPPGAPAFDPDRGLWFSAAMYRLTIGPETPAP